MGGRCRCPGPRRLHGRAAEEGRPGARLNPERQHESEQTLWGPSVLGPHEAAKAGVGFNPRAVWATATPSTHSRDFSMWPSRQ